MILVTCLIPTPAQAQGGDARVLGVVIDDTGSFVPGATITIKNERTGEERTVRANGDGRYVVAGLKPSVYTLRATFGDFAPLEYTGLQLVAAQELAIDLALKPAGLTETVTVEGRVGVVDLSSARIGVDVAERDIDGLPVNGRQMSQLMLQSPGIIEQRDRYVAGRHFSGRAVEQNAIRYDGIEGSAIIDAAPGNLNGEVCVRSSCRRVSTTFRNSVSNPTATRPNLAPAPADKSTSSRNQGRTSFMAPRSSTCAMTARCSSPCDGASDRLVPCNAHLTVATRRRTATGHADDVGTRVLVVEDERDIADLIEHTLQRSGDIQVDLVDAGEAALRAVSEIMPALTVLDLDLPVPGGFDVCRILRGPQDTARIPIIMLTARTAEAIA